MVAKYVLGSVLLVFKLKLGHSELAVKVWWQQRCTVSMVFDYIDACFQNTITPESKTGSPVTLVDG